MSIFTEKFKEVISHEGVVSICSQGADVVHLVNSWNSYLTITSDGRILLPVGGMKTTEANINVNPNILMTVGSREVEGLRSPGAGFLVKGRAGYLYDGVYFDNMKKKFPWARAVMEIKVDDIKQTL